MLSVMVPEVLLPIVTDCSLPVRVQQPDAERCVESPCAQIPYQLLWCDGIRCSAEVYEHTRATIIPVPNDFFSRGMMVAHLRHLGTTAWCGEALKTSVRTSFSCSAHSLSTHAGVLSGPAALRG